MSRVPEGWKECLLKDVAQERKGKVTPDRSSMIPCVCLEHLAPSSRTVTGFVRAGQVASTKTAFKKGDVLFGKLRPYLQKVALAKLDGVCSTDILVLYARKGIDGCYLYSLLASPAVIHHAVASSAGTKMPRTSWGQLAEFLFFLPPLPEQKKIAAILSSVDDAIAATQAVIDQTRKVKEGLLQDLLARGIGHTRFKQTEIGEIPEGWEVRPLGALLRVVERPIQMADNQEYQLVTVKRRHEGVVPRSVLFGREILVKSQFMVERGDFVISKRQIVHGACGVVPDSLHGSIVSNEYCVLNSKSMLDMEYFRWATRTPLMMKYFMMSSIGVHIEKMLFKLRDWLRFSIPVPPLEEQKGIAAILNAAEVSEVEYGARLECLRGVKRGLMQDLLSGDVRVCA